MGARNSLRRWGGLVGVALLTGGLATPVWAEPTSSHVDGALRKLGRGVANIATAPLELLRTPTLVSQRDGYLAGISVGVVQGAWRAIQRAAVGAFEVVTFYAEIPNDFGPLMKPEFVWAHGKWEEDR